MRAWWPQTRTTTAVEGRGCVRKLRGWMRAPRAPVAFLRFLATVSIVSGVLLLLDVGATLLWQEPVSAAMAGGRQAALGRELETELRKGAPPGRPRAPARENAGWRLDAAALGRSLVVVEGTDEASLRRGPGHYPNTALPGEKGTVGIAGHRTTWGAPFRSIDRLQKGDVVTLTGPEGRYRYAVEGSRIVSPRAVEVVRPMGYQRLVLTACHPLYSAAQRFVVFARRISDGSRPS